MNAKKKRTLGRHERCLPLSTQTPPTAGFVPYRVVMPVLLSTLCVSNICTGHFSGNPVEYVVFRDFRDGNLGQGALVIIFEAGCAGCRRVERMV